MPGEYDTSYDSYAASNGNAGYEYNVSYDNSLARYSNLWTGGVTPGQGMSSPGASAPNTGGANWYDAGVSWLTEGTGPQKSGRSVLSMAMPSLVSGGLAALSELFTGKQKKMMKLKEQEVDIQQQNANSATARTAQSSYGNSMPTMKKPAGGLMYRGVTINRPTVKGIA